MTNENCPVCNSAMGAGYSSWHYVCRNCGYEMSDLEPKIYMESLCDSVSEDRWEESIRGVRLKNYEKLLSNLARLKSSGARLLDVGCAHGWFLEVARSYFDVCGLEPDDGLYRKALKRGMPVRSGYFPESIGEREKFDVIVFNDVFEHISDLDNLLARCRQHLNKDGLLVLNLPSSEGVLYRISKVFRRLGYSSFFERLWQKGLPSPHLHYFNLENLEKLLANHEFEPLFHGKLRVLMLSGLYDRCVLLGNHSAPLAVLIYVGLVCMLPLLKFLPSDIMYCIAKRD